jgi:hypothetical protein
LTALVESLKEAGFRVSGGRALTPSMNSSTEFKGLGRKWPFCFYSYQRGAALEVRFEDFKSAPEFAEGFLTAVTAKDVPGINASLVRERKYASRPTVMLHDLTVDDAKDLVVRVAEFAAKGVPPASS